MESGLGCIRTSRKDICVILEKVMPDLSAEDKGAEAMGPEDWASFRTMLLEGILGKQCLVRQQLPSLPSVFSLESVFTQSGKSLSV